MFVCPIHFAPGWIDKESTLLEPRGGEESGKEKKNETNKTHNENIQQQKTRAND
jgi:hypothetical protein